MRINLAWVPNSLTLGNLLLGFVAIIVASKGSAEDYESFVLAGLLILGAALFDGLDCQVARALKVESTLGAELDSLADLIKSIALEIETQRDLDARNQIELNIKLLRQIIQNNTVLDRVARMNNISIQEITKSD